MAGTFISYRREDAAGYAGRLRESLERRLGTSRVFRDVDALRPGQDFVQAIESRLATCGVMLVVIGREWLEAKTVSGSRRLDDPYDFVRLEVAAGIRRSDVLVVPVLVEGVSMPLAAELPDDIRPLARRHAVSVRDETWDTDVDRLVTVIDSEGRSSDSGVARRTWSAARPIGWTLAGVVLLAVIGLALARFRSAPDRDAPPEAAASTAAAGTGSGRPASEAPLPAPSSAYAIDMPRVAEVAFGDLIYTLVSGNVTPRDAARELRLRIRIVNGGVYGANFWDRSFRLLVGGEERPPTGGLDELAQAHSLRYGIVTFALPAGSRRAVLRMLDGGNAADIPLDLSPTGRAAANEEAEIPDSLSQAIVRPASKGAMPLVTLPALTVTLNRVSTRRFVNLVRFTLSVSLDNREPSSMWSTDIVYRLAAGDAVLAPVSPPSEAISSRSTASETIVFDVPPAATRVTLRTIYRDQTSEHAIDVP